MGPFKKKQILKQELFPPGNISFSQVDTTERFGDNIGLTADEWITTIPLYSITPNPESMGLPAMDTNADEIFQIASSLSRLRESISMPNDGVYCPICHIANIDSSKLHTPCPRCGRELLKFGWD
jgi:hypothetical protein